MTPKEYDALVRQLSPSSPIGKDTALAFVVGGGICAVGQLIANGWQALGLTQQEAASATSVTLVFLSVLLTALGLYHRLARYAGAGTLVPITGFANAVASPAIDFRAEGIVTGTAAELAGEIYRGEMDDSPVERGAFNACQNCEYSAICAFDPLRKPRRRLTAKKLDDLL